MVLKEFIQERFQTLARPEIHPDEYIPQVALLIDATTVVIPSSALMFEQ